MNSVRDSSTVGLQRENSEKPYFSSADSIVKGYLSPNKKYVAVLLYGRSSGPEGGRQFVALRATDEPLHFNQSGEVESSQIVFDDTSGSTDINELMWKGNHKLVVTGRCHDGSKADSIRTIKFKGIEVISPDCPNRYAPESRK